MINQKINSGQLLGQANQLKRSRKLEGAIVLHHSRPTTTLAGLLKSWEMGMAIAF
ncbi:hypothetical protein [Limnospira fusiformis]|uniref:hypothetical protein n=1 Tax=Limnospira fusiformis TaxID=54297 RepID=UPI002AA11E50|nr:hypothetical protein [Limnospira fusiformis LS22]